MAHWDYEKRAIKTMTDEQLLGEYQQAVKARFDRLFGRNAAVYQNIVADELHKRGITSFPGLFGPIEIEQAFPFN